MLDLGSGYSDDGQVRVPRGRLPSVLDEHRPNVPRTEYSFLGGEGAPVALFVCDTGLLPLDTFHWEPHDTAAPAPAILSAEAKAKESQIVNTFLRAILEGNDIQSQLL